MSKTEAVTRPAMRPLLEPYGLAEAVRANGFLFLAGQTGLDASGAIVAGGLGAQARRAFENIRAVVEHAGGRPEHLVSLTWYLVERPDGGGFMADALEVTKACEAVFPGLVCGSTAVQVKGLLSPEMLIEIQGVCAL